MVPFLVGLGLFAGKALGNEMTVHIYPQQPIQGVRRVEDWKDWGWEGVASLSWISSSCRGSWSTRTGRESRVATIQLSCIDVPCEMAPLTLVSLCIFCTIIWSSSAIEGDVVVNSKRADEHKRED
jgi:hypothetical protein